MKSHQKNNRSRSYSAKVINDLSDFLLSTTRELASMSNDSVCKINRSSRKHQSMIIPCTKENSLKCKDNLSYCNVNENIIHKKNMRKHV
jgi:hypothetical protein